MLNAVLGYDCDGYKIPYASAIQVDRYADRYYRQCLLGLCRALSIDGPGRKVLGAVKGHANCEFVRAGLNRLFKNYMRPYKAKMPGPSYYRIPFHRELNLFLLLLTLHNAPLLEELCGDPSFLLPRYLATRLAHPDESEPHQMALAYQLFTLSPFLSSPQLMSAISSNLRPDSVLDILTGTLFNMSLLASEEWKEGELLVTAIEYLAA